MTRLLHCWLTRSDEQSILSASVTSSLRHLGAASLRHCVTSSLGVWHTSAMRRLVRSTSSILWALALALFVVRASDAHMHMCFDGSEPARALHFSDGEIHHGDETGHKDVDVDAVGPAVAKSIDFAFDFVPAPRIEFAMQLPATQTRALNYARAADDPAPGLPPLFLPRLRGPPL